MKIFKFIFRKKQFSSESLYYLSWLRFKKDKMAMAALFFILLSCFIAVFGYLFTPDSTPNSNDQHLELATKNPGFSTQMLLITKNQKTENVNFFSKILFGEENKYNAVPLNKYRFDKDQLVYSVYNEEKDSALEKTINIADVVFPLAYNSEIITNEKDEIN